MRGPDQSERQGADLPLVLLPGTLCDERVFAPLICRLPGVRTRVMLSVDATCMQQAAEDVLSQLPERFALLGFSLGGMLAMEVAAKAPERLSGLALISTTPWPVAVDRHAARRNAVELAGTMAMDTFVRTHLWPDYRGQRVEGRAEGTDLALLQAMALSLGPHVFGRQTEMALGRPDYRPMLKKVRCPALVVGGDQDRLCPPEALQVLHQRLRHSTLRTIAGAGHLALLERPDEIAQAVAAWFHTVLQQQGTSPGE